MRCQKPPHLSRILHLLPEMRPHRQARLRSQRMKSTLSRRGAGGERVALARRGTERCHCQPAKIDTAQAGHSRIIAQAWCHIPGAFFR
mmetsp:Transcript_48920/g.116296  ORF Transcript_48920/g.116296 Transcript_48920/m.116296 type:complete len:88 (-) Transcript_48920:68-331(-)